MVTLNLLWSEFAETNERRFDLLLQILITHWLSGTCVVKIRRSGSKRRSFVSANSLQSKFKVAINLILGAVNNIFHIDIYKVHKCLT